MRLEAERKDQAVADAERLRSNAAKESERLRARLEQETDKRSKEAEALKERLIKSQAEADRQRKIMKARCCVEIKCRAPHAIDAMLSPWPRRLDGVEAHEGT